MHLVEEKWDEILLTVKREHELTDISFNTWLKPLQIFSIQNNRIYILVSGEQMGLTYINRKYYLPLKVAVAEVTGTEYEIEFVLPEQAKKLKTPHPRRRATTEEAERSNLNPTIHLIPLWWATATALPTRPPWRWPNPRRRRTTPCSSTGAWVWARPT